LKFAVVVFPGSNCDHDVFHAVKRVIQQEVEFLWHNDASLSGFDAVILPGGFAYGDYLRAGAIARFSHIMEEVVEFACKGKIVLGICNGFQVLTECGLLPGALMRNQNLRFVCKHVYIKVNNESSRFTNTLRKGQVLKIPIAHGEGNYYIDDAGLKDLLVHEQILFQYCSSSGEESDAANPNGSRDNIAGIINKEGNVLGMMPHPERAMEALVGSEDGQYIFKSICS
jgi:phosphoribosylformylglycinamidine synthase